jgi:hypothetical protein
MALGENNQKKAQSGGARSRALPMKRYRNDGRGNFVLSMPEGGGDAKNFIRFS